MTIQDSELGDIHSHKFIESAYILVNRGRAVTISRPKKPKKLFGGVCNNNNGCLQFFIVIVCNSTSIYLDTPLLNDKCNRGDKNKTGST